MIHQSVREGCQGFYVVYQPIVDSETGHIVGAEALVRWRREPYGNVPPGMFIEWMEKDPGMYELGNYVMQTALQETVGLLELLPEFVLNVNVSARQMEREEFRGMAMDDYGTGSASSGIVLYAPMDEIKLDMSFIRGITEEIGRAHV